MGKAETKVIRQHYVIKAPIEKVWLALTDADSIEQWSGAKTDMTPTPLASFKLWGGDIWGTNTFVAAPYHLEQEWFGSKDWAQPSKVCFALMPKDEVTEVELCHCDVPESEEKDFADGWNTSYFEPLKAFVEA